MKLKQILAVVLISAATTLTVLFAYNKFSKQPIAIQTENGKLPANYAGLFDSNNNIPPGQPVDFQDAAKSASPAVVHINTVIGKSEASNNLPRRKSPFSDLFGDDFFDDFFNGPQIRSMPQRASGSGVLISEDGYIVTNNHVIDEASEIKVTLADKKSYTAKLIGTDPSSDLAVIKIESKNLPFLLYGNSDNVKLGQWVLAIGYPLNLETTVTAGIVSAKARTLGLNARKSQTPIESFIQTDAAVNQGNSGGALVNTNGELVGIVSAIASPTGAYAGYSYAIPVNIVKKIVNDLLQYGTVQRAYLGISYAPEQMSDEQKNKLGVKEGEGVYVTDVAGDGAASAAGIKKGDIITKINGSKVNAPSEMVEQIANYKPGDKISVSYKREGKENTVQLALRNRAGNYEVVKSTVFDALGAEFENVDKKVVSEYGYEGGVKVKTLSDGMLSDQNPSMKKGFVIVKISGKAVRNVDELRRAIENAGKSCVLEGFYPGFEGIYSYSLNDLK
ncbi:MAG: trypsin-like peptidase domain-containing protein [Chitinophagaceae bacterium]|nr:trypsin-like peptidase domain-containing protein [Chitinophagaceae bacterium]